nr:peroxidase 66 [Tanacetum cinerariifolium]
MAKLTIPTVVAFLLILTVVPFSRAALNAHYYDQTCPQAESIIFQTIRNASIYDPKVPARLLRMFFHDCFIRGCDASLLLDSTPGNKAEKDGPPNVSVRSYYVIDDAKTKLEKACPRTVSCSDVLAIAARDVVAMKCPGHNKDRNAGEFLDSTSAKFDNDYYKRITIGKGVFGSDQALYENDRTKSIVDSYAKDEKLFFAEFAASMVKLGNVGVIEDGEIRVTCSIVN